MTGLPADFKTTDPKLLHSHRFNELSCYEGSLGFEQKPEAARFRLWAPTAVKVELLLYLPDEAVFPMYTLDSAPAVWEILLKRDCRHLPYMFRLSFADGHTLISPDPYARAADANGRHSIAENAAEIMPHPDFEKRMPGFVDPSSVVIYELHIRDFTIAPDNGIQHKGKFLGLCESGCRTAAGHPAGLDYLLSLGITHVQLMPVFDFATVDEEADLSWNAQYNWGYDPLHYNVPEGSYATQPGDPSSRILELKKLIDTLHKNGLRVIMDVVYNHVYRLDLSPLALTVPSYYFRYGEDGHPLNGTGVGNETASEQCMYRKYMIDSLCYWAKHYNLDGFRFDLMGIHDCETLRQIRSALDAVDPNIILLGEGWTMGYHPEGTLPADQQHADKMPGIAFFNDDYRDALRGSNFHAEDKGFISGAADTGLTRRIYENIMGRPPFKPYRSALQSVIYTECHDNMTLYDKLKASLPHASEAEIIRRHGLALCIQGLSQGLLFIHAGQELLRTKRGLHDTYNAPDELNAFPYDRVSQYPHSKALVTGLIKLRRECGFLRLSDPHSIAERYSLIEEAPLYLHYSVNDGDNLWHIIINADTSAKKAQLKGERWLLKLHDHVVEDRELHEASPLIPPLSVTLMRGLPSGQ